MSRPEWKTEPVYVLLGRGHCALGDSIQGGTLVFEGLHLIDSPCHKVRIQVRHNRSPQLTNRLCGVHSLNLSHSSVAWQWTQLSWCKYQLSRIPTISSAIQTQPYDCSPESFGFLKLYVYRLAQKSVTFVYIPPFPLTSFPIHLGLIKLVNISSHPLATPDLKLRFSNILKFSTLESFLKFFLNQYLYLLTS